MINIYGLKNCDSCRKARKWFQAAGRAHRFIDLRQDGFAEGQPAEWVARVGWEILLNKRGSTWRNLPDFEKENLDEKKAVALMESHPAVIKRPVFDTGETLVVGFGAPQKEKLEI